MALLTKYFVLKPKGDNLHAVASRKAMISYANTIEPEDSELATQLRQWIWRVEEEMKHNAQAQ